MQSLFVGAGILLATGSIVLFKYLLGGDEPTMQLEKFLLDGYYSFFIGALASILTVMWSVWKTPEIPPNVELKEIKDYNKEKPSALIQIISVLLFYSHYLLALGLILGISIPQLFDNINLLVIIIIVLAFLWFSISF